VITIADPIDADALRVRHEFLVRPDLRLSARTVAQLLGISPSHAERLLDALAREGFLRREFDGKYHRPAAA
jgi:DNA-binding IclR family transcriptional regulator